MPTKRQIGHMYPEIDRTRNFIGGECPHGCIYCYVSSLKSRFPNVRKRYTGKPFLIEKELQKSEGSGHFIFVQDCGDLFAESIPTLWIRKVLRHLENYPNNLYLLQTKNPSRLHEFMDKYPPRSILGTTIESNRDYDLSKAPEARERYDSMVDLAEDSKFPLMVSIEPILDFDLGEMVSWIKDISPAYVSIGADSKNNNLPEPHPFKIINFINEMEKFTEVRIKFNLKRLGIS